MINICVVFGGVSCEHDISIITAMQVINNLDISKYNVLPIYITKQGEWLYSDKFVTIENVKQYQKLSKRCTFVVGDNKLYIITKFNSLKVVSKIDISLIAMHGINGEDGLIKAVFDVSNIKCVSSNILPSSICLDKCAFYQYFKSSEQLNILPSVVYDDSLKCDIKSMLKGKNINFPVIIKPSKLGSSIGISVVHSDDELLEKIKYSLKFDSKLLIQHKLENFKEYNIALFSNCGKIIVSDIEQPINNDEILSYQDKYLNGNKSTSNGMLQLKRIFPANIDYELKQKIISDATFVYQNLGLTTLVRFDFIYDIDEQKIYLNEVNTIPGSFAYYLFRDLSFSNILDKLIKNIYFVEQKNYNIIKYFKSNVLNSLSTGKK